MLCWIDDLGAWMRSVRATLRAGGQLVLVDGHPLVHMIAEPDPLTFDLPYAHGGGRRIEHDGTYADRTANVRATTSVQYAHSLVETVTEAVRAGLRIEELTEHLDLSFEHPRGVAEREADGRRRFRVSGEALQRVSRRWSGRARAARCPGTTPGH